MTEPLEPEESGWLDAHLAGCGACREIDAAYRSDRATLRAMRVVPPPRDLWARTSAALDREQGRAGAGRRSRASRRSSSASPVSFPQGRWAPVGAIGSIAAVMVVGFLVGNAVIGGGRPTTAPSPGVALGASATPNPVPTPIVVAGGDVAWVSTDSNGSIVLKQTTVKNVCPPDNSTGCTPIGAAASNVVTLSVKPASVHQSPTSGQMVVFGTSSGGTGVTMYVINTGKGVTPTPTATASVRPTSTPRATPTASTATAAPGSGGPSPSDGGPSPSGSPVDTTPPATPDSTLKPSSTATIVPNVTPAPSAATLIAVASNVDVLNAETAAYSTDGAWFAFTGRPHGVALGSDIYLWRAGDGQAKRITDDSRSVFAGWFDNQLIGSRAVLPAVEPDASVAPSAPPVVAAGDVGEADVESFFVDPTTLNQSSIPTAAWRPAVDPTGKFVVYWEGTVAADAQTGGWRSATGRLVLRSWPIVAGAAAAPSTAPSAADVPSSSASDTAPDAGASAGPTASTSPSASPDATESPTESAAASVAPIPSSSPSIPESPTPSPVAPSGLPTALADASGVDWAAAWDETGTHLALWIGDSGDRSFGHLSLLALGADGAPAAGDALVTARPALPGFALNDGHLAWATPPGMNAEGSRLTIFDYSGVDSGERSGQPGTGTVVVVQH